MNCSWRRSERGNWFGGDEMANAKFGNGYGSECHLLRYLGRHRERLDCLIRDCLIRCKVASASDVRWLDFPFASSHRKGRWPDAEWESLDFLLEKPSTPPEKHRDVLDAWKKRWPHGSGVMNWDAVGQIQVGGEWEWLLVEAKSHTGELKSNCGARDSDSIKQIKNVFEKVKGDLKVQQTADWLTKYYQYANRLAVLHHLDKNDVKARLLLIYFCGDAWPWQEKDCPQSEAGWDEALKEQEEHLGLPECHRLTKHIHKLFLPVWRDPKKQP